MLETRSTDQETPLRIGDPIEVRRVQLDADVPCEVWIPATTQFAGYEQIVAVFADGTRLTLERRRGHVRRVKTS